MDIPAPDPEVGRCCYRPDFKLKGGAPKGSKECNTCGAHAPSYIAKQLNKLPTKPGIKCRHEGVEIYILSSWFQCPGCRTLWDHRPEAFESSALTFSDLLNAVSLPTLE